MLLIYEEENEVVKLNEVGKVLIFGAHKLEKLKLIAVFLYPFLDVQELLLEHWLSLVLCVNKHSVFDIPDLNLQFKVHVCSPSFLDSIQLAVVISVANNYTLCSP